MFNNFFFSKIVPFMG